MEQALTDLLASVAGGRRYWLRAPQGAALPYVVLQRVSGLRVYDMAGPSGLAQSRVQIDCYAETYGGAKTVSAAVLAILSGYRGGVIQGAFVDAERDDPAEDAGQVQYLFRVSLDLMIHSTE